jgi:hypothetical protein
MNILKVSLSLALLATSTLGFAGQRSVNVWKNYFPNAKCSSNGCAKNVPSDALEAALDKITYLAPRSLKKNKWMFVADFTQHSKRKRGYLINIKTGQSTAYHVAHGRGSGDGNGNAVRFSNTNGSHMSSKGLYLSAELYTGKHGLSMRMDGKERYNSRARSRAIVVHGASYMSSSFVAQNGRSGRSHGCPAVANNLVKALIKKLKNGSPYYIHAN